MAEHTPPEYCHTVKVRTGVTAAQRLYCKTTQVIVHCVGNKAQCYHSGDCAIDACVLKYPRIIFDNFLTEDITIHIIIKHNHASRVSETANFFEKPVLQP